MMSDKEKPYGSVTTASLWLLYNRADIGHISFISEKSFTVKNINNNNGTNLKQKT